MIARKLPLLLSLLILAVPSLAQPPMGPPGPGFGRGPEEGPMREKVRERIETVKIWKLTEAVGLTSQQSEQFFPLYNKHQKNIEDIDNRRIDLIDRMEQLLDDPKSSDKDIQATADALKDIPRQMMEERQRFMKEISPILPLRQQMKLMVFEERFKQKLQEFVRDMRREFNEDKRENRR